MKSVSFVNFLRFRFSLNGQLQWINKTLSIFSSNHTQIHEKQVSKAIPGVGFLDCWWNGVFNGCQRAWKWFGTDQKQWTITANSNTSDDYDSFSNSINDSRVSDSHYQKRFHATSKFCVYLNDWISLAALHWRMKRSGILTRLVIWPSIWVIIRPDSSIMLKAVWRLLRRIYRWSWVHQQRPKLSVWPVVWSNSQKFPLAMSFF